MNKDERILFTPAKIGNVTIKNRFVRSATFENAAGKDGSIGGEYIKIYDTLSKGETGLIITGMIHTGDEGRSYHRQAGLHSDEMISAFLAMNDKVHRNGSKIFAQLCQGGRQSNVLGLRPGAPSTGMIDLIYRVYPRPMQNREILSAIQSFAAAAKRAQKAGFDGIQIHAAHGYLISQFLSPYFNRRKDEWGGTVEKRFNFLKRVYESMREAVGSSYPLTAKINIEDHTPYPGLMLEESVEHIKKMVELGIDAVEISCGTLCFSMFNQSRGQVPVDVLSKAMIKPLQPFARMTLKLAYPEKKFRFSENYNLRACGELKPLMGGIPLILVGGVRDYESMSGIVRGQKADFVSLCRPFIRQPMFVKSWAGGDVRELTCNNCNKCFGFVPLDETIRCNLNRKF